MNGGYEALAPVYDRLNRDVDYAAWADFITEKIFVPLYNKGVAERYTKANFCAAK